MNELLLIGSLVFIYGSVLAAYRFFGKTGLYIITAIASIGANIECLLMINAFGMEQTLGNVFFASTFLITDILSENHSKKAADKAVWIGFFTTVFFIIISQSWLLYTPSESDTMRPAIEALFTATPRTMIASLIVYIVSQFLDVRLYHLWWKLTEKKSGSKKRFLWLRNNGSTLISQLLNTALFTLFAFFGIYDVSTLISIMISSYIIFVFTSLLDTPVIYLARKLKPESDSE